MYYCLSAKSADFWTPSPLSADVLYECSPTLLENNAQLTFLKSLGMVTYFQNQKSFKDCVLSLKAELLHFIPSRRTLASLVAMTLKRVAHQLPLAQTLFLALRSCIAFSA